MPPRSSLLPKTVEIALAAGDAILRYYRKAGIETVLKSDQSPLTQADLEADRLIVEGLSKLGPSIPCISEERGIAGYSQRKSWKRFWLVDPLDGTKEFLKGLGEFTVNIALIEGTEPVLGVVYAPAKRCLYYAQKGRGSWKRSGGGRPKRIRSVAPSGRGGWSVVESRSHPSPELERFLGGIRVKRRIQAGSSLKFCLVAEGRADLYPRFGPTMEWDTAAGDCVWRNSGRAGPRPSPLVYNKPSLKNGDFVIGAAVPC